MDAWMPAERRRSVAELRRKPDPPSPDRIVHLSFEGGHEAALEDSAPPAELRLEGTCASGETPDWLDDFFWMDVLRRWSTLPLSIHILPTYESLLHPMIGYQMEMLRRVAREWRLIGHCYLSDLEPEGRPARMAMTVYHEIRIIDGRRPGCPPSAHPLKIEEVIATMRQVQAATGRRTPIFARCRPRDTITLPDDRVTMTTEAICSAASATPTG